MSETAERSVIVERVLAHPAEKVWRALTQPALIEAWIMPNDFAAEPGRRFSFRAPPQPHWDGVVNCEVLEVEPLQRLTYSWNTTAGLRTIVTFTLATESAGTRVRMEQSGFGPEDEQNLRGATFGWNRMLDALVELMGREAVQ